MQQGQPGAPSFPCKHFTKTAILKIFIREGAGINPLAGCHLLADHSAELSSNRWQVYQSQAHKGTLGSPSGLSESQREVPACTAASEHDCRRARIRRSAVHSSGAVLILTAAHMSIMVICPCYQVADVLSNKVCINQSDLLEGVFFVSPPVLKLTASECQTENLARPSSRHAQ